MDTEILHTADTHLGYRQYHKPEREEDFRAAFEKTVTEAIEKDVDAVVHAGDLFNRSRPSINTLSNTVEQLKRLNDAGIEFCTIVGNHDGTRDRQWPEFLEDLGLAIYLDSEGDRVNDVTLYGQDYVDLSQRDRLKYEFASPDTPHAILVGHGLFTPFPHGDWDLDEVLTKATVSFDAVLLGDDHTPRINDVEGTPVTYPGSTERTAADQKKKRVYNLITVNDEDISINHETIDTRDFHYIEIDMGGDDGTERVIDRVDRERYPDDAVVVVTLTGDGKRVPSGDVERAGLRKGALTVQVNDRRDFEDIESEFEEVEFTDPEDLIEGRKDGLSISPVANELEEMARDIEGVPQSNLKDLAEQQVDDMVHDRDSDEFDRSASPSSESEQELVKDSSESSENSPGEVNQMNLNDL